MFKKKFVPFALSGLLFASPLVLAEEAHHPEDGAPASEPSEQPAEVKDTESSAPAAASGMGMMGGQQGGGPGGMMMGRGGKMGMMHGGKGGGMGGHGHGMKDKHRKLIGRLDLLEARMAKIETMLERLLLR